MEGFEAGLRSSYNAGSETSMEVSLEDDSRGRQIYGNPSALKKARADKKFAYVVALARAVNALNSAHSLDDDHG